jgi:arginase family enzyme
LQRNGATAVPVGAMRERGIEQAVADALEIAGRDVDSIYLTVDIDVCDNTAAPGTGYTNLGGLSSVEFLRALKALGRSERIEAIDLVEVTPPRDVGGRTAYLAARGLVEFLRDRVLDPGLGDALIG